MNSVTSFIFSNLFIGYVGKCWGFLDGSAGKESACSAEGLGSIPGLGRSPGGGNGYPLQYFDLENSMDYGPWGATSQTRLSSFYSQANVAIIYILIGITFFFFFTYLCIKYSFILTKRVCG